MPLNTHLAALRVALSDDAGSLNTLIEKDDLTRAYHPINPHNEMKVFKYI